jgi:hypothetical protein
MMEEVAAETIGALMVAMDRPESQVAGMSEDAEEEIAS